MSRPNVSVPPCCDGPAFARSYAADVCKASKQKTVGDKMTKCAMILGKK